ncbi:transposase [Leptothermofonsia sichuanensis E412]|uniref:helix-turn-helix domain-containing protein n=1 Tax=Leptothermofonsia sichuanensis TaxID=2917832 RepID=UPI001CA64862|nr:transposase [Leptothermofonsia sichuanensis]QZZ18609.1 transposase [Leptothermofonsia sichuanensis E412]QZZ22538.1 transposase [Leptothermofonsia sichuanensis E412]
MPAPLSVDLRQRIMAAYEAQEGSQRQLAERFKVSLSFIRDLRRHYCETGTVEPKAHGGGAIAKLGKEQLPIVEALVTAQPDALLKELCERFAQQSGVEVSISTMQQAVSKLKLSVKKNTDCLPARYSKGEGFAVCLSPVEFYNRPAQLGFH